MAHCHGVCAKVDQANNDLDLIIQIAQKRNLTYATKKIITGERYKARNNVRHSLRYTARCTICDFNFTTYTGLECPCCGQRVNTHARNSVNKEIVFPEPVMIVRSHVDYKIYKRSRFG